MIRFTFSLLPGLILGLALFSAQLHAQPVYAFDHLQVEACAYQAADPDKNWALYSDYLIYLPEGHDPEGEPLPVLLFLHGAGRRGSDLNKVATLPPPSQAENGAGFSFAVVAPQCLSGRNWTGASAELMQLLEEVVTRFNFDRDRIYICGQSMGGAGTWGMLTAYPDYFAAAMPICGGGDPSLASRPARQHRPRGTQYRNDRWYQGRRGYPGRADHLRGSRA